MAVYDLFLATMYGQALYLRGLELSFIFILKSDNNKPSPPSRGCQLDIMNAQ